jgi:hypothetical protein
MPTFESIYELEKYLNQKLEKSMDVISNDIKKDLINNYQKLWYDRTPAPSGESYKRTNQLTKGVTNRRYVFDDSQHKFFDYEIGFYGDKIKPEKSDEGLFNSYMILNGDLDYKGMPITEAIAYWIEKGTNNRYYSMPAKHVFQATAQTYDREKVEIRIKNSLKRQGVGFE